ncbi:PD-(D/E)XK nuclease family protein [Calditrichota bacterium]
MIDHLSASQIQNYLDCGLKYKFSYIVKLPKPFKPSGMALGSAIHSAVDWIHKKQNGKKKITLEAVWDIFEADWYAIQMDTIAYREGESEDDVLNTGRNLLGVYFNDAPKNGILQSEQKFQVPLVNLETGETLALPLVGVFDKIEEDDVVADLKTWARMVNEEELDANIQLSAYAYAYRIMFKKTPELRLDILLKTKKPRFEQLFTSRNESGHIKFYNLCKEVYQSIQKNIFLPNPSWKCAGCEYRQVCWLWQK